MKPIDINVRWLPGIRAITLWPFCLYAPSAWTDDCTHVHEYYHWHDALKWGVVPWYAAYLILAIKNIGKSQREHPMEREAYRLSDACDKLQGEPRTGE